MTTFRRKRKYKPFHFYTATAPDGSVLNKKTQTDLGDKAFIGAYEFNGRWRAEQVSRQTTWFQKLTWLNAEKVTK